MLHHLLSYAHRHLPLAEAGFKEKSARWAILADGQGRFLKVLDLAEGEQSKQGLTFPRAPDLAQSELVSKPAKAMGLCHFLIDGAEVVVRLTKEGEEVKPDKALKHECFKRHLRHAATAMPELALLAEMLDRDLEAMVSELRKRKCKPTDKITLAIDGAYPVNGDGWHDWWRAFRQELGGSDSPKKKGRGGPSTMRCFATGELIEPAATHGKIGGLGGVGGLASGCNLVSFDKSAFTSFGLEQSANAAVSESGVAAYVAALNDLVAHRSRKLGPVLVVHWFDRAVPVKDDPLAWLVGVIPPELPEANARRWVEELLEAIRAGKRPDLARNRYFALTLSGAAARVMVRDWMEGDFAELAANVNAWFDDQAMVNIFNGELNRPPKFLAVAGALVRDLDELQGTLVSQLWSAALKHQPIPSTALSMACGRTRIDVVQGEERPLPIRMGLIRAWHLRHSLQGGDVKPTLNEEHPDPAYHCGRLLAVLAGLQRSALRNVHANVVQRLYPAASSTPALVLGRLIRTSHFHLGKLEGGLAYWYENRIAAIMSRIGDRVPRTLSLERQSLFALGYYQQLAENRTKKAAKTPTDQEVKGDV